jgi:hypothetical protein
MLSSFDDYPVHQIAEPVAHPSTTDRNFYDRYWFNGTSKDGSLYLGAAFGLYPNRQVMDAAFSVLCGKQQQSLHASRRAPEDRGELTVGPVSLEMTRPMRELRLRVASNQAGLEADLVFRARTAPHEEARSHFCEDNRVILDTCRFAQYGSWEGSIRVGDRRIEVDPAQVLGARDRSWGVRPVGEPERGATPRKEPGIYWIWSALHFEDTCLHFYTLEDHDGRALEVHAAELPAYASPDAIPAGAGRGTRLLVGRHSIAWQKGTRWSSSARLTLLGQDGVERQVLLEPLARFHMKGIGYQHREWAHGMWKGEQAQAGESWNVDELDPTSLDNVHVQQLCRARLGDRTGIGVLEQVVIGSHRPSGLKGLTDGAAG